MNLPFLQRLIQSANLTILPPKPQYFEMEVTTVYRSELFYFRQKEPIMIVR